MSKNELHRSGEHRRCGFANGARELGRPFLHACMRIWKRECTKGAPVHEQK